MKLAVMFCLVLGLVFGAACGGGGGDDSGNVPGPQDDGDDGSDDGDDGGENGDDGDGDGDGGGSGVVGGIPGTGTQEELETAARTSFEAFAGGDDLTYYLSLSFRCRDEFGYFSVESYAQGRRTRATQFGGVDFSQVSVTEVVVSDFSDSAATVSLEIAGAGEGEFVEALPQPWVAEDGGWRLDECSEVNPPQGGLEGLGMDRDEPLPVGGVASVNGWLLGTRQITLDAEELVLDGGGDGPAGSGQQYVDVLIGGSFQGPLPSAVLGEHLSFALVNGSTEYGEDALCGGGTDFDVDLQTTLVPGDDFLGGICREVDEGDVDGDLLLRVTHLPTGDEFWFQVGE